MNKLVKGLVLVVASTVMSSAFALTIPNPAAGSLAGDAQAGTGNQKGLVNQSGSKNQTGLVNAQSTGSKGSQQGAFNLQQNQKTGNAKATQDGNTQASGAQVNLGAGTNTANVMTNAAGNYNVQ